MTAVDEPPGLRRWKAWSRRWSRKPAGPRIEKRGLRKNGSHRGARDTDPHDRLWFLAGGAGPYVHRGAAGLGPPAARVTPSSWCIIRHDRKAQPTSIAGAGLAVRPYAACWDGVTFRSEHLISERRLSRCGHGPTNACTAPGVSFSSGRRDLCRRSACRTYYLDLGRLSQLHDQRIRRSPLRCSVLLRARVDGAARACRAGRPPCALHDRYPHFPNATRRLAGLGMRRAFRL